MNILAHDITNDITMLKGKDCWYVRYSLLISTHYTLGDAISEFESCQKHALGYCAEEEDLW